MSSSGSPGSSQWLQQLREHEFYKVQIPQSPQKITPNLRVPDTAACPSPPGQMHLKLASFGFIGGRRKGWQMGLGNKSN